MRRKSVPSTILTAAALSAWGLQAKADDQNKFSASFSGFQEVGALNNETGAIFSQGQANLSLQVDAANQVINYKLTYSGLSADVLQSHIHFGKRHVPGGVMVFFCTNLGNGPSGVSIPVCPNPSGTVTGTITASSVVAIPGQNVTAGNFGAVLAALRSDTAYGNIHTKNFPAGEIRGQILPSEGER
jgi:CHRD domain